MKKLLREIKRTQIQLWLVDGEKSFTKSLDSKPKTIQFEGNKKFINVSDNIIGRWDLEMNEDDWELKMSWST